MPISDELHDLVGNPVPSGDLGRRARQRAAEITRRRLAGIATAVAAVAVIAVPSAILASGSGQATGTSGAGSASVAVGPPASAQPVDSAAQAAKKEAVASLNAGDAAEPNKTNAVIGTLTAADKARVDLAQHLLGASFSNDGGQVEVDATTGARLGLVATFVASAGGGTVGINWEPVAAGSAGSVGDLTKGEAGTNDAKADAPDPQVQGVLVSNDTVRISLKVVQGSPGSEPILPGKAADTVAQALLASEQ